MKINRTEFLRALQSVEFGTTEKPLFNNSECVIMRGGEMMTFNEHVACRAPSGMPKDFTCVVPYRKLMETASRLTVDEVEIELEGNRFVMIEGKDEVWVTVEVEDPLPATIFERPKKWEKLPDGFAEAIDVCRRCVYDDENKFAMTCVSVTSKWVEASDYEQICRFHLDSPIKQPFIVQGKWAKPFKIVGAVEIAESETWAHFRNDDGAVYSLKRYMDEYPDITKHYAVKGNKVSLPKTLVEAIDLAKQFTAEDPDNDHRLKVDLRKNKLIVSAESLSGGCRKVKNINYDGERITFYASPDALAEVVKRHPECVLTSNRLKIEAENMEYVMCLQPDEKTK